MSLWIKNSQTEAFNPRINVEYRIRCKYEKMVYTKLNLYKWITLTMYTII